MSADALERRRSGLRLHIFSQDKVAQPEQNPTGAENSGEQGADTDDRANKYPPRDQKRLEQERQQFNTPDRQQHGAVGSSLLFIASPRNIHRCPPVIKTPVQDFASFEQPKPHNDRHFSFITSHGVQRKRRPPSSWITPWTLVR